MNLTYIDAIVFNAPVIRVTLSSVSLTRICGQKPIASAVSKANADVIMTPVRGAAIRLASRKWRGKLLKYSHARGPVVI